LRRLGIASGGHDREIAGALVRALATKAQPIDRIFFDWRGGRDRGVEAYPAYEFRALAKLLEGRERMPADVYWSDEQPCSLHIEEVEAIWSAIAERDDWQPFNNKVKAIRRMGVAVRQDAPQS
jgi:serine/tyrosine/threonine adenylyltransferase